MHVGSSQLIYLMQHNQKSAFKTLDYAPGLSLGQSGVGGKVSSFRSTIDEHLIAFLDDFLELWLHVSHCGIYKQAIMQHKLINPTLDK